MESKGALTASIVVIAILVIASVVYLRPRAPTPPPAVTQAVAPTNSLATVEPKVTNGTALPTAKVSALDKQRSTPLQLMREALELTDEQAGKLEPILQAQQKQLAAFRRETSPSRQERMARLKQMRETTEAQLKSILTPEQFETWRKRFGELTPAGSVNLPAGVDRISRMNRITAARSFPARSCGTTTCLTG
jgi:Spy/CpxP family protein refolding chaperone